MQLNVDDEFIKRLYMLVLPVDVGLNVCSILRVEKRNWWREKKNRQSLTQKMLFHKCVLMW